MRNLILAALLAVSFIPGQAQAHKVIASVYSSGDVIEGEIGFSNGDVADDATVEVFDGDGNKIGEVQTDEDGFFTYKPTQRTVHVFRADLGAGHVANARMEVEDLPILGDTAPAETETATAAAAAAPQSSQPVDFSEAQREMLAELIHHEVNPLRREIAAYKEKNDFQTILGGIGYILGLFGLAFYIAAKRASRKSA